MDVFDYQVLAIVLLLILLGWRILGLERVIKTIARPPESLHLLQREVQAVRTGVDERLREQLDQTQDLTHRLGRLLKATENVEQLGVGLAELQKILQPPHLRGVFGERLLEDLITETLPRDRFRFQHSYQSGVRVDAVILLGDSRLLPIDSKFPLDNFRRFVELRGSGHADAAAARRAFARDVKRHVDELAEKYLSPEDGALDLAFMYIPSESIFHEVAAGVDEEGGSLAEFALRRRIIPVSPNTLHAYLSVVRLGIRGFRLQENARQILQQLDHVQKDVVGLRSDLDTAIRQARHSLANLKGADNSLSRVEDRLQSLSRGESTATALDPPGSQTAAEL